MFTSRSRKCNKTLLIISFQSTHATDPVHLTTLHMFSFLRFILYILITYILYILIILFLFDLLTDHFFLLIKLDAKIFSLKKKQINIKMNKETKQIDGQSKSESIQKTWISFYVIQPLLGMNLGQDIVEKLSHTVETYIVSPTDIY